jgi:hypothetical protein
MLKRLLQAATITFLLNLLAHMNPPESTHPDSVSHSREARKLLLSLH